MVLVVLNKNCIFSCLVSVGKLGFPARLLIQSVSKSLGCCTIRYEVYLVIHQSIQAVKACSFFGWNWRSLVSTSFYP